MQVDRLERRGGKGVGGGDDELRRVFWAWQWGDVRRKERMRLHDLRLTAEIHTENFDEIRHDLLGQI